MALPWKTPNPYIIAEIGSSHSGDLVLMRELVQAAAEAGASCIKTQIILADEIIPQNAGSVPLPGGSLPLYERFRELEQTPEFYLEMQSLTHALNLQWTASAFGAQSSRILKDLNPPWVKIASPELNYSQLIQDFAKDRFPMILSTGVSKLADIENALAWSADSPRALMHCITAYPAPEEEFNLALIPSLKTIFGVEVGLSDHSLHPWEVPLLAVHLGAPVVEKHFTLSREHGGLDDPIALEPKDFSRMVKILQDYSDQDSNRTQDFLDNMIPPKRQQVLKGNGQKVLAGSEKDNYSRTNRSIHVLRDLPAGTLLQPEDLAIHRTEKILRPGLPPELLSQVLGCRIVRDIQSGDGLVWEDLLERE